MYSSVEEHYGGHIYVITCGQIKHIKQHFTIWSSFTILYAAIACGSVDKSMAGNKLHKGVQRDI